MSFIYAQIGFVFAVICWFTLIWMLLENRKFLKGEIKSFIDWMLVSFVFIFFKGVLDSISYINAEYNFLQKSYRDLVFQLISLTGIIIVLCFFKAVYELSRFADAYGFATLRKKGVKKQKGVLKILPS